VIMAIRRDALAARREALGFTQETLAEKLGVDRTTVGRWECGTLSPQPWRRTILAKALKLSLAELDVWLNSSQPQIVADCPPTEEPVELVAAVNVDQRQHVDAALADARRYFDGAVVNYFRRQLDIYMADDGEHGSVRTLPAVLGLLSAVDQHGREVRPAVRRGLLSFAACGAEFVGWLYRDANDPLQAGFWYDRATEWAQEAGDLPMQGYVLLKRSQMAYDARDALRVLSLAQAALDGPWQLPRRIRAEVTLQEALGMAMCGEPLPAVERKLGDAGELLAAATTDTGQPGVPGAYFTDTTLMLRTATALTEAGKPARSALMFAEVLAGAGLSRRDTGFFRARRATALALSGEPDEAATVGLESIEVAAATNSRRTLRVLAEVSTTLAPWRGRPVVRELNEAMAASGVAG
jgi:transcriptional regulator with XRE-family HTH domain